MQTFNVLPKLLVAAVVTLAAGHCAAAVITTAQGDGADAFVRGGDFDDTPHGAQTQVTIKNAGSNLQYTRKGYLRFDLSAETGAFTIAELELDVTQNSGGSSPPNEYTVRVYGLNDAHTDEGWDESAITWNNAPANETSGDKVGEGATFLGRFTVPAQDPVYPVNFDAPTLRNFLNQDTDGLATFILRREGGGSGNNLSFASKEHGSAAPPALSGTTVPAQVLSISTNDGDGADSFIQLGDAAQNFGSSTGITIKDNDTSDTTRKGYLRFDLAGAPPDILDAALTLQVTTNNQGSGGTTPQNFTVDVFGLVDGHAGELWDEMDITWNNAPANAGGDSLTSDAIPLGSFEVLDDPEGSRVMFTSSELISFLSDDTNDLATLILTRQSSSGSHNLIFASGEHGSFLAPTLTITGVPEPSTGLLLAFALLGLAGRYGRRSRRTAAAA